MKLAYDLYDPHDNSRKLHLSPIILHHGIIESRKTWRAIGQTLANQTGRKVYAIDARNHGDSPWTDQYNYSSMIGDLYEFLEEHNITQTVLLGHSMGGKVAIQFAIKYPNKVESLIIEDVPVKKFKQRKSNLVSFVAESIVGIVNSVKEIGDKTESEKFLRELGHAISSHFVVPPEVIETYDLALLPMKWTGKSYELEMNLEVIVDALFTNKLVEEDLVGKYNGKTLFIYGKLSQMKVYEDTTIETYFPEAIRIGFEGVGHFIHGSAPQQFLHEVVTFINRNTDLKSKY